jgi:hypothetical protein
MFLNRNHSTPSTVSKPYLQQPLKKNPSKHIFGNSRLSPLLGILIGLTKPERGADWILTIQCSDHIGLDTPEHILGFLAIPKNHVIAMDITA